MYTRKMMTVSALFFAVALVSCDPQKLVNDYFARQGLNPLAVVRNDIKPGALIIKKGSRQLFVDSIYDYAPVQKPTAKTENLDHTKDFDAVLKKYETDRQVGGSVAANFLKTVLPINISADLGLTNKVTIDLINAQGHRLMPVEIQTYLSEKGKGLQDYLSTQEKGSVAYVAYETYTADTLSITAESGTDVSAKVELSTEFKPLSSGNASFKYKRTSKETLLIKGDKPYVFAVRTGKLVIKNDVYVLEVTNFASGDVKAVGGDEQYSAPVQQDYAAIKLERIKPPKKKS